MARRHTLLYGAAGVLLVLDYLTKAAIVRRLSEGETLWRWGIFSLTRTHNTGAAFSFAQHATVGLTILGLIIASAVASALWRTTSWWWGSALALILGGAWGNLIDRFLRPPSPFSGYVVDFISVGSFPVFNIADACVTVGSLILMGCFLTGHPLRAPRTDTEARGERA